MDLPPAQVHHRRRRSANRRRSGAGCVPGHRALLRPRPADEQRKDSERAAFAEKEPPRLPQITQRLLMATWWETNQIKKRNLEPPHYWKCHFRVLATVTWPTGWENSWHYSSSRKREIPENKADRSCLALGRRVRVWCQLKWGVLFTDHLFRRESNCTKLDFLRSFYCDTL